MIQNNSKITPFCSGIINLLFDGLTYNTRGHFARPCEARKNATQLAKYPRVLYVKPLNKMYILPLVSNLEKFVVLLHDYKKLLLVPKISGTSSLELLRSCFVCIAGCTYNKLKESHQLIINYWTRLSNNRDLSVASRSIIYRSRRLRQIIDLRDTEKSPYFAITEVNNCFRKAVSARCLAESSNGTNQLVSFSA